MPKLNRHAREKLDKCCKELGMICNTKKTKCMILNPSDKTKTVSQSFLHFTIVGHYLQFVDEFHYLGQSCLTLCVCACVLTMMARFITTTHKNLYCRTRIWTCTQNNSPGLSLLKINPQKIPSWTSSPTDIYRWFSKFLRSSYKGAQTTEWFSRVHKPKTKFGED